MPRNSENWAVRQTAIRDILASATIRSQAELASRLQQFGFSVTQSSVSRDLAEMHAFKIDGRYVAATGHGATPLQLAAGETDLALGDVLDVQAAGPYLLVVRTPAGRAASVAIVLDQVQWPEIIGTIAGDDTVFVATDGRGSRERLQARLTKVIPENHHD